MCILGCALHAGNVNHYVHYNITILAFFARDYRLNVRLFHILHA